MQLVPDIDKGKRLERIEHELDPFCEAGQFETFKRFAKGQISNQVKSGPDVPFEHVHRSSARCLHSFAQLVNQLSGEMLQDILLLQKCLVRKRGQEGPADSTVGLPFRGQDGVYPIRRRLKEGRILAEAFARLAVTVDGLQGLDADVRELARRRSNNGTILFVQLPKLRHQSPRVHPFEVGNPRRRKEFRTWVFPQRMKVKVIDDISKEVECSLVASVSVSHFLKGNKGSIVFCK